MQCSLYYFPEIHYCNRIVAWDLVVFAPVDTGCIAGARSGEDATHYDLSTCVPFGCTAVYQTTLAAAAVDFDVVGGFVGEVVVAEVAVGGSGAVGILVVVIDFAELFDFLVFLG